MIVTPDGFIAGVFGSYPDNMNDAIIMANLLKQDVWDNFQNGDIIIIDRGFRDAMDDITKADFFGEMPSFVDTPPAQLTTKQANNSRLVSKTR
ncbi:hypothetical protein EAI_07057 [Harpegnathos saltator]|uniref:DDE Tnp4 domain-containing protein n=1 Tax=Harpegnathos saltator TaxID=610380 RepID=E2BVG1_HARSA|nr:hypothetical protein EAI_07057 [Harpegnathos saltator]